MERKIPNNQMNALHVSINSIDSVTTYMEFHLKKYNRHTNTMITEKKRINKYRFHTKILLCIMVIKQPENQTRLIFCCH